MITMNRLRIEYSMIFSIMGQLLLSARRSRGFLARGQRGEDLARVFFGLALATLAAKKDGLSLQRDFEGNAHGAQGLARDRTNALRQGLLAVGARQLGDVLAILVRRLLLRRKGRRLLRVRMLLLARLGRM